MTITNAIELGAFIAQWVLSVSEAVQEHFDRGEVVTVDDLREATDSAFETWRKAKARHWRLVEQLAEETQERGGDAHPPG